MGAPSRRALVRRGSVVAAVLAVALAALVLAPLGALAAPARGISVSAQPAQAPSGIQAEVYWNGVPISTAATFSAAFRLGSGGVGSLIYDWNQSLLSLSPWLINDARLQIFYFGFALGTRDIGIPTGEASGTVTMGNWSTGALQYILEGTFLLTASLVATNGTTAWSQSFWVDISAPFYILAVLPIVLILIAIYEIYSLLTSGKYASVRWSAGHEAPPSSPGAASPAAGATPEAGPGGTGPTTPPPGGAT